MYIDGNTIVNEMSLSILLHPALVLDRQLSLHAQKSHRKKYKSKKH